MTLDIMSSSCATAQARGTAFRTGEELIKDYAVTRPKTSKKVLGCTPAHSFVIFTIADGLCTGLKEFVEENKLGEIHVSSSVHNPNHMGWGSKGSKNFCVLYVPDHDALTEWYQKNVDSTFRLKPKDYNDVEEDEDF